MTGGVTIAPGTTTIDFPKYADLQIFLTINFDPGTGHLSALGLGGPISTACTVRPNVNCPADLGSRSPGFADTDTG